MSKQTNKSKNLEETLRVHYQSPSPSPDFVRSLEIRLKGVEDIEETSFFGRIVKNRRSRRAMAPVALALIMVIVVAIIGPQEVLAQVQGWIGYVPGVGFVDVDTARILNEPLTQVQDDVTLTVKQVLANGGETFVVISMDNFPAYEDIEARLGPLTEQNRFEWIARSQALWNAPARLILDDGSVLESWNFSGSYWDGYFSFPVLPEDKLALTLEIDRIPGIPADLAPGNWTFTFELMYARDPQELDLPEATPVGVSSEILHGVSLRVLDVVYAPSEISIRSQLTNTPAGWKPTYQSLDSRLHDELGNEYAIVYGPNSGVGSGGIYTTSFRPLMPESGELHFSVVNLSMTLPLENQFIMVDFGTDLQVDDRIELDQTIDVLGMPVEIVALTVREGEVAVFEEIDGVDQETPMISYDFEIEPLPFMDGLGVSGIGVSHEVFALMGGGNRGSAMSGSQQGDDGTVSYTFSIGVPADQPLASGIITLPVEEADVTISGPFSIEWVVE